MHPFILKETGTQRKRKAVGDETWALESNLALPDASATRLPPVTSKTEGFWPEMALIDNPVSVQWGLRPRVLKRAEHSV